VLDATKISNTLNAALNPIRHLLALAAHHILHSNSVRVKYKRVSRKQEVFSVLLSFGCVDEKNQLDVTFEFFISLLLVAQHVSGNHVPIIRS
jgi:hypothetical protein